MTDSTYVVDLQTLAADRLDTQYEVEDMDALLEDIRDELGKEKYTDLLCRIISNQLEPGPFTTPRSN